MTQSVPLLKKIHESFKNAAESEPAYREILPFFENLYEILESAVPGTHPKALEKIASAAPSGNGTRTPLMDRKNMEIDRVSAKLVLGVICKAARDASPQLADAAAVLSTHLENDDDIIQRSLDLFINSDAEAFQSLSGEIGVDQAIFAFFLNHSIWPSLAQYARHFQEQKSIAPEWQQPYCPVCGSAPNLAFFAENGQRFLVCGYCRQEWSIKRILCTHCGNEKADTLNYFFSEEEKAYRVDTCDLCKGYIKTVDTRQLSRHFFPPLESLMTLHLDFQAESLGYKGGEDSDLFAG